MRGEKVIERRSEPVSIRDHCATLHHGPLHYMRLQGEGLDSVQIILTTSEKAARDERRSRGWWIRLFLRRVLT